MQKVLVFGGESAYNHASFALRPTRRGRGEVQRSWVWRFRHGLAEGADPGAVTNELKKVVDELLESDHNLASLLLTKQRCRKGGSKRSPAWQKTFFKNLQPISVGA
jgi:hypothetical protein